MRPFMRYVAARFRQDRQNAAYRSYIADGLYALTGNTARIIGGGQYLTYQLSDIMNNKAARDSRSGDEIAADVIRRAGLRFRTGGDE